MSYKDPNEQRSYQLLWITKRRNTWIKENGPCQRCGSLIDLQVDHVDKETKKWNPSGIWSRNENDRESELTKCQVLCSICHNIKSSKEKKVSSVSMETKDTIKHLFKAGENISVIARQVAFSRRTVRRVLAGGETWPGSSVRRE